MTRGIIYIAFGSEYDKLTAHTVYQSRKNTDLPFCILTNIKEESRSIKWVEVSSVCFKYIDLHNNMNRDIKTRMNEYSPFDETLYLDCDSIIRNKGIEKVFDDLKDNDLVLNLFLYWKVGDKLLRIYKKSLLKVKADLPLSVYNGAFICFQKRNQKIQEFFPLWNKFWKANGSGREMPALACAIKKSIELKTVKLPKGFFCPDTYDPECIVQHNYNSNAGMNFFKEFNLPKIKQFKPFDKAGSGDWNWVRMEDE